MVPELYKNLGGIFLLGKKILALEGSEAWLSESSGSNECAWEAIALPFENCQMSI